MKLCLLLVLAALVPGVSITARGADASALPTLTTARQVFELSREEAARGYPVRLQGVLTFHAWALSFFQDDIGAIYINNLDPKLYSGAQVVVEGWSAPGRTHPIVTGRNGRDAGIRLTGQVQWPQPVKVPGSALNEDRYDARWVSVSGKVTKLARIRDGIIMNLLSDGVVVPAVVPHWPQNWALPGYLNDLPVTVRGVVSRKLSQQNEVLGSVLCVPLLDMVEADPDAMDKLFKQPRETYLSLYQYQSWENPLVRIYGQVEFVRSGLGFFMLVDGINNVWVQTSLSGQLTPGGFVDVVGRIDSIDQRALLMDAYFRPDKSGTVHKPWDTQVSEINEDKHGNLIQVEGRLVAQQSSIAEDSLVLENHGVNFLARLFHDSDGQLPRLQPGSLLRLSGICVTKHMPQSESLPATFGFQLWLASPVDVKLIQLPPWWTVERVFLLCGVILCLGLLAAGWAALLRRQVAKQATVIASQREREAVAQERTRIARELHDTLEQELVGIGMHLNFVSKRMAKSSPEVEQVLSAAQKMVSHSQVETKRSVADLRADELDRADLPDAMEELVKPLLAAAGSTAFHLNVEGSRHRLDGILEHYLLRIGQEAVANAIRHGHAAKIEARIGYGVDEVVLEVRDDGCGFDTAGALTMASGHFGLLGMEERVNKLRGRLRIDSRPGAGTVVSVTVPLKENPAK